MNKSSQNFSVGLINSIRSLRFLPLTLKELPMISNKKLVFVIAISLFPALYSHAQSVTTQSLDPSALQDGIAMQVFSKLMVQMSQVDPKRYGSYVEHFLGFSTIDKEQLLEATSQMIEVSESYAHSELEARCGDETFMRIRDGNNVESLLRSLEAYRQDTYAQKENLFLSIVQSKFEPNKVEALLEWVLGDFKSGLSVTAIKEAEAVRNGQLNIDEKLDFVCASGK